MDYVDAAFKCCYELLPKIKSHENRNEWDGIGVMIPLEKPYQTSYYLEVRCEQEDGEKYYAAQILNRYKRPLSGDKFIASSDSNSIADLQSVVKQVLFHLSQDSRWVDATLESAWRYLTKSEVPFWDENDCLNRIFLHFPAGTQKDSVYHWFDDRYSDGVVFLLRKYHTESEEIIQKWDISDTPSYDDSPMSYNELKNAVSDFLEYCFASTEIQTDRYKIYKIATKFFSVDELVWLGLEDNILDVFPDASAELNGIEFEMDGNEDYSPQFSMDESDSLENQSLFLQEIGMSDDDNFDNQYSSIKTLPMDSRGYTLDPVYDNCSTQDEDCELISGPCCECRFCKNWYEVSKSFSTTLIQFTGKTMTSYYVSICKKNRYTYKRPIITNEMIELCKNSPEFRGELPPELQDVLSCCLKKLRKTEWFWDSSSLPLPVTNMVNHIVYTLAPLIMPKALIR